MGEFDEAGEIFASYAHWHSMPLAALAWTEDGEHLYSGGGEAVLVKWNVDRMEKVWGDFVARGTHKKTILMTFVHLLGIPGPSPGESHHGDPVLLAAGGGLLSGRRSEVLQPPAGAGGVLFALGGAARPGGGREAVLAPAHGVNRL